MEKLVSWYHGAWRSVRTAAYNPIVAVLMSLLLMLGIIHFFNDAFETALLLVIPVALVGWLLGWRQGALFGLFAALLLTPSLGSYTSLVTPSLEPYIWFALGSSYIVFGLLLGLQGAHIRNTKGQYAKIQAELRRAQESMEHYESIIGDMTDGQKRLQRMNEELALLNTIATSVNSSLNIEKIQRAAIANIYSIIEVDDAQIYWISHDDTQFVLKSCRNMRREVIAQTPPVSATEGLLGRVKASQSIEVICPDQQNVPALPPSISGDISSVIAVPLLSRERLLGVLLLARRNDKCFTEDDKNFIASVGRILTVALENATLFQQAQDMSLTDELTGVANRRMFNLRLSVEMNRVKGSHAQLCLVMLDLDFFKAVNDHYGHPAGDEVLGQFAQRIQDDIRNTDLFCRIGGEEFALVVPDTPLETTIKIARRIVERIAANPFALSGGVQIPMTISAGVAAYSNTIETCGDLIMAADQALYTAKTNGRNRVEVYTDKSADTPIPA